MHRASIGTETLNQIRCKQPVAVVETVEESTLIIGSQAGESQGRLGGVCDVIQNNSFFRWSYETHPFQQIMESGTACKPRVQPCVVKNADFLYQMFF